MNKRSLMLGLSTEEAVKDFMMNHHHKEDQLLEAIEAGKLQRVVQLLSSGISLNTVLLSKTRRESTTVLGTAAHEGQVDIVRYLIQNHASVNYQDPLLLRNALHWACIGGHEMCVQLLIDSKTDVNCSDRDNVTPLIRAAMLGRTSITKILIDNGSQVNKFDRLHSTALHYATFHGSLDVCRLLIIGGCIQSNNTIFGQGTPLANLVYHGDLKNTCLLIEAGYNLQKDTWILDYNSNRQLSGNASDISEYLLAEYKTPPSLQRTCRKVIRDHFDGVCVQKKILSLPLPSLMKSYLSLETK